MAGQAIPPLLERDRITRGLILRLDDPVKAGDEGEAEQLNFAELLVPFATQCLTYAIARSDIPPKHEPVDLARMAIVQRMLNALPGSFGLARRHLYVEAIASSRPLLEGALLLRYFLRKPERAKDWFENAPSFIHLGKLRKEIDEEPRDPMYSWSSERGEHVTAAGFSSLARVGKDGKQVQLAIGGSFDAGLQTEAFAVLLMSAGTASGALVDTFLRDTVRLSKRGQQAFVQLMKADVLEAPRLNAIRFISSRLGDAGADTKALLNEIEQLHKKYVEEAAGLEKAGLVVPAKDESF